MQHVVIKQSRSYFIAISVKNYKSQCAVLREVVCDAVHRDKSEPSVSSDDPRNPNKVASQYDECSEPM